MGRHNTTTRRLVFSIVIMFGPRWVDYARLGDVKETTLEPYRGAATRFLDHMDEEGMAPGCVEEFDDLIVEWSFVFAPT